MYAIQIQVYHKRVQSARRALHCMRGQVYAYQIHARRGRGGDMAGAGMAGDAAGHDLMTGRGRGCVSTRTR